MTKANDQKAMDKAIADAREGAKKDTMKLLTDIRTAERAVLPLIGEVSMAADSADAIYIAALKHVGVDTDGVHSSALPALVAMAVKSKNEGGKVHRIAQDAAGPDDRAAFDKAHGITSRPVRQLGAA